uniref:Uncharacterized protein n=1 Tax=Arundo donax TaxID=35708 RepID=A0A0A9C2T2_ARUDO
MDVSNSCNDLIDVSIMNMFSSYDNFSCNEIMLLRLTM